MIYFQLAGVVECLHRGSHISVYQQGRVGMGHRCKQLHMLLPEWMPGGYWLKVLSQPWEGDVTMVLPSMVWQIRKAISNPTKEELYLSLKQARATALRYAAAALQACG